MYEMVRCICDASGLLVCTLWVPCAVVLPLLSPDISAIPSLICILLCWLPSPYQGLMATAASPTGAQPHSLATHSLLMEQRVQCWCSQGRWMHKCCSGIGCSCLPLGSPGNSKCLMCSCAVGWKS